MKRTFQMVSTRGTVRCKLPSGDGMDLPIFPGILKHPSLDSLPRLLKKPHAAQKYTLLAIQKAPWQILKQFPVPWLRDCLDEARISPQRRRAIEFLLSQCHEKE